MDRRAISATLGPREAMMMGARPRMIPAQAMSAFVVSSRLVRMQFN